MPQELLDLNSWCGKRERLFDAAQPREMSEHPPEASRPPRRVLQGRLGSRGRAKAQRTSYVYVLFRAFTSLPRTMSLSVTAETSSVSSPMFTIGVRPVRTILPAVAAATVLPSFRDISVPSGRYAVRAMIADKNFGKIFKSFQSNMF